MREDATRTRACHQLLSPAFYLQLTGRRQGKSKYPRRAGIYCAIGLVGGLFGGLLGIGGGSVIAPLLLLTGKLRPFQVSGTTLSTVVVISLVGSLTYASFGHLNLALAWPIAMGSVAGSIVGALSAKRLSVGLMVTIFVVILPYFALKEFWPSFAAPVIGTNLLSLGMLGFAAGILSGFLGISGASLVVPSLVAFFLIDHQAAQGIAMGVALADSLAGAGTHARAGNIQYRLLIYMAPPALIGALSGALLSNFLSGSVLRVLFGSSLVVIWLMMVSRPILAKFRTRSPSESVARTTPSPVKEQK